MTSIKVHVDPPRCLNPACRTVLTAATQFLGDLDEGSGTDEALAAVDGAWSVCAYCGDVAAFVARAELGALHLRPLRGDELAEALEDPAVVEIRSALLVNALLHLFSGGTPLTGGAR